MAAILVLAGCRGDEEAPPKVETLDVPPALSVETAGDPVAVERLAELIGVLPGDFPTDLPLYLPASLIDFGPGRGGLRSVSLLSPHARAPVESGLLSRVSEAGWSFGEADAEGARLLRKGRRRVWLRIEDASPGILYRFEYSP